MKVKHIALIPLVMLLAIGVVVTLAWKAEKRTAQYHSFYREVDKGNMLTPLFSMNKPAGVIEVAGFVGDSVYFKMLDADKIYVANKQLTGVAQRQLNYPNTRAANSMHEMQVDAGGVYIWAGNVPAVYHGSVVTAALQEYKTGATIFTRGVKLNDDVYVLRGYDRSVKMDQLFYKVNVKTGEVVKEQGLSPYKGDLGISTDGMLHYDGKNNCIVYVNYYTNAITVADTLLRLVYSKSTIDPTATSDIEVGVTKNANGAPDEYSNKTPKRIINKYSCVSDGRLYVYSTSSAQNEDKEVFAGNAAVDVYNIKDGSYLSSFYIPNSGGERVAGFKVDGNNLVALYKSTVAVYRLPLIKQIRS